MCMIFYIVIKWLDELEKGKGDVVPFGLLCVAGVYALTLKLTAGLILGYTVFPQPSHRSILSFLSGTKDLPHLPQ